MPSRIRISHQAARDIQAVLDWTLENFGPAKRAEYEDLIRRALTEVACDPEAGHRRPELHEAARTFHIAGRGKRARHFLLLRVAADGVVEIGRLLYDGMDLASHLPPEYEA
jgi:toxin ParE1/3/4